MKIPSLSTVPGAKCSDHLIQVLMVRAGCCRASVLPLKAMHSLSSSFNRVYSQSGSQQLLEDVPDSNAVKDEVANVAEAAWAPSGRLTRTDGEHLLALCTWPSTL